MKIDPKSLLLDLLLAAGRRPLAASHAIAAGALFGISANNIRVTLARLTAEKLLESAGRGRYRLGPAAKPLAAEVSAWRTADLRLRPWKGAYLAAHCGGLGRTDRKSLRRRERALQMMGFRELDRDLHVRPDNIEQNANAVRSRLHKLGLEQNAGVFVISDFDPPREARIRTLWDTAALNSGYRKVRRELETWLARSGDLDPATAARESFLLGGEAIRRIVYDPLLPEPFIDALSRAAFFRTVLDYDRAGHAIWRKLFESLS